MSNNFLFIIPLTPPGLLTPLRKKLQIICFETLLKQTYTNWQALLIGESDIIHSNMKFINVNFEGHKEEKLQVATEYIINQNIACDYIIRLDDDDIFNPYLLEKLVTKDFDLYVDKFQSCWDPLSGMITKKVMYWFPNTCIHSKTNALSQYGNFPLGNYQKFKSAPLLIENEHNDFHKFYIGKEKVIFAPANDPVYLRALNQSSITSVESSSYIEYLHSFGYWRKNRLLSFGFLNSVTELVQSPIKETLISYMKNKIKNFKALKNYNKLVRTKI